jgi:hypothetical protein
MSIILFLPVIFTPLSDQPHGNDIPAVVSRMDVDVVFYIEPVSYESAGF